MLNYLAQHAILELKFPVSQESSLDDTKILGIVGLTYEGDHTIDITQFSIDIKANKIMLHSFYEKYQSCNENIYTNNIVFQQ